MPTQSEPEPSVLAGLPGSADHAGTGPAVRSLFTHLLEDAAALQPGAPGLDVAAAGYRRHLGAWYRDVVGSLAVPASAVDDLLAALAGTDRGLPLVLATDASGLDGLRQARNMLLEDDRVELAGVHVGLPEGMTPAPGARALLAALDFSAPARVDTGLEPGWGDALAVLAADGAEEVALQCSGGAAGGATTPRGTQCPQEDEVATLLRRLVDLDLTVHLVAGPHHAVRTTDPTGDGEHHGLLNVLCAVRAALNGAEAPELATILAERRPAPLASAVRRMSEADAAVVRAFVASCACADVAALVDDLVALGLLDPTDEG